MTQTESWLSLLTLALAAGGDAGLERRPEALQRQVGVRDARGEQSQRVPSAPDAAPTPAALSPLPRSFHLVDTLNLHDNNCRFTTGYTTNPENGL